MHRRPTAEQIAALYAAAPEADAMMRMIKIVCDVMNVDSAGAWLAQGGVIQEMALTDDITASTGDYLNYYHTMDPWGGASPKVLNEAHLGSELFDEDNLVRTEFYNDFSRHYGMLRPMGIALELSQGTIASFNVNRTSKTRLLNIHDKPLLQELGIHIRAALRLHQRFRTVELPKSWQTAAFDALSFGVLICCQDGTVLYANEAALALSERGGGIVLGRRADSLKTQERSELAPLRTIIWDAALGRPGAMRLTAKDGGSLSVIATPLPIDDFKEIKTGRAFLCLSRNETHSSMQENVLRRLFGLSPSQAGLCVQLAAGLTFEEAAADRGIAVTTARTHFQNVLARTQTRNLRDLLRMMASLPPVKPF